MKCSFLCTEIFDTKIVIVSLCFGTHGNQNNSHGPFPHHNRLPTGWQPTAPLMGIHFSTITLLTPLRIFLAGHSSYHSPWQSPLSAILDPRPLPALQHPPQQMSKDRPYGDVGPGIDHTTWPCLILCEAQSKYFGEFETFFRSSVPAHC